MVRFRSPAPITGSPSNFAPKFYGVSHGRIPEWPKGADCKSVVDDFGGSNPPPPTKKNLKRTTLVVLGSSFLLPCSDTPITGSSHKHLYSDRKSPQCPPLWDLECKMQFITVKRKAPLIIGTFLYRAVKMYLDFVVIQNYLFDKICDQLHWLQPQRFFIIFSDLFLGITNRRSALLDQYLLL